METDWKKALKAEMTAMNIIKYIIFLVVCIGLAILCSHIMQGYFTPGVVRHYGVPLFVIFSWSLAYSAIVNFVVFEFKMERMMILWGICFVMFSIINTIMGGPLE